MCHREPESWTPERWWKDWLWETGKNLWTELQEITKGEEPVFRVIYRV